MALFPCIIEPHRIRCPAVDAASLNERGRQVGRGRGFSNLWHTAHQPVAAGHGRDGPGGGGSHRTGRGEPIENGAATGAPAGYRNFLPFPSP